MFTKYKQLILSAFVLICCLTDITHAKSSYSKIFDYHASQCCDIHHHYKHLSRHALRKTTLAMHRAHQRAINSCRRAYYHTINHYKARMHPQAQCQAQQHELLKHLAQLQAQCALSQEETARTLQATQQALQLQQEQTAATINQLTEKLAAMQQQYAELEQKYKNLEQPVAQQESQDAQEAQELIQPEEQPAEHNTQESTTQELPELQGHQQPDAAQQALLDELSGKKHAAQEAQESQESSAQAPILESKEPQPELHFDDQLDTVDQETNQEPTQQSAPQNAQERTQDKSQDQAQDKVQEQEVEVVLPEEIISGKSVIDDGDYDFNENQEDAAFEQRLLSLLQEKQQDINRLTQEKQALEHENTQLKQEIKDYQTALKEAHDKLFITDEQPQQEQRAQDANIQQALQQSVKQHELENYQTTLNEMLDLYYQQLTEKKTLQHNLTQAQEYINKQQAEQQQTKEELHKTQKELLNTNTQLKRAFAAFNNEHNNREDTETKYKTLRQQLERPRVSQATQTQTEDTLSPEACSSINNVDVKTKYVSLISSPHTNTQGKYLYDDYTLTFTIGNQTIVMNTNDTPEQNKQATQELISILDNLEDSVSEQTIIQLQSDLQQVLESCPTLQERIEILRNLFYKRGPSVAPHVLISLLIIPSLDTLSETAQKTNVDLGIYQSLLSKMLQPEPDNVALDLSDQEEDIQEDSQELEEQEQLEQPQPEQRAEVESHTQQPQQSQRSWLNPLNWFRRS